MPFPILLFGAAGQLGQAIQQGLPADAQVTPIARADVDLRDGRAVRARILDSAPALVVNCAAYTNVDGAEDEAAAAMAVNGLAVGTMARAAAEIGATFVHFGTDFVFDGTSAHGYTENDQPEPRSVYGQSKLLGDWLAADCPAHYVLRVQSLYGGPAARSTIDRIAQNLRAGGEVRLFEDRTVSPSFVDDVVMATRRLLENRAPYGLYHCAGTGTTTWLEMGREIATVLGINAPRLVPVKVADVQLRAARPQFAALSNAKLVAAGIAMPTWQDGLRRYLARAFAEPAGR